MATAREKMLTKRHKIALALQGGGSHGAFTWGVLDRLLAEPSFDIVGVTGTSAGAMNAAVLADGLVRGGPAAARTSRWSCHATRRTFSNADICVDAVLASACLPDLFPAVEIDGQAYWDGGYTGNPARAPLNSIIAGLRSRHREDRSHHTRRRTE